MQKLSLILIIVIVSLGCSNSSERIEEEIRLHEMYFNVVRTDGSILLNSIEKARAETPNLKFFKKHGNSWDKVSSSLNETYEAIDTAIVEHSQYDKATTSYKSTLHLIDSIYHSLDLDNRRDDQIPFSTDLTKLGYKSKKLELLKMKLDLAISHSNLLTVWYTWLDGCDGFKAINIKSKANIDSTGTTIIVLSDEVAQRFREGRHIIIDEVIKDGSPTFTKHSSINDHTFAKVRFDSLDNGNYKVIGKVRYYTITKGTMDFPFEEYFEVK